MRFRLSFFAILTGMMLTCTEKPVNKIATIYFTTPEVVVNEADKFAYIDVESDIEIDKLWAIYKFVPDKYFVAPLTIEGDVTNLSVPGDLEAEHGRSFTGQKARITFIIPDDDKQEADQIVSIKLVYPQDNGMKSFFGSTKIDETRNQATLKILSNEKLPTGTGSMKVNGILATATSFKTYKITPTTCDEFVLKLMVDDCNSGCETEFGLYFKSLPVTGQTISFFSGPPPITPVPPDKVLGYYKKHGFVQSYPESGSITVLSHDAVNKKIKISFSGKFIQNDGVIKVYQIEEGIIDLSLYDFTCGS